MSQSFDLGGCPTARISGPAKGVRRAPKALGRFASLILTGLTLWLLAGRSWAGETSTPHSFAIGTNDFLLDGQRFRIRAGALQPARVPREYWRHRLQMARAMGLNTVSAPLFWNLLEPRPGEFDWSGQADLAAFCRLAQEEGLWVILQPGPHACAEWEMGGLPWWLLKEEDIRLRTRDPKFLPAAKRYLEEFARVLAPLQVTQGGPVLMVQVENQYGAFGKDSDYLGELRATLLKGGFTVPLFTCDPVPEVANGLRADLFATVSFATDPQAGFKALRAVRPAGPLMCGDFHPGWADTWGSPHHAGNLSSYLADLTEMLRSGASFNIYLAHGGTTLDLRSGVGRVFKPQTSSYDYDAPISEAGWATEKFFKTRELFSQYRSAGETFPDVPPTNRVIVIPQVEAAECAPLLANLPAPLAAVSPGTMEQYDQGQGCLVYRTTLAAGPACVLEAASVHDLGLVFLDGERVGIMDRRRRNFKIPLPARARPATLDILVEAMGRADGQDRKGLHRPVSLKSGLTQSELKNWQVFRLPLDAAMISGLQFGNRKANTPAFWRAKLDLAETGDTFLDLRSWGKGVVWLNGHCLGRFWNIGPTQTMYVPGPWLKPGENEIIILDLLGPEAPAVAGLAKPILNELHPERDFSQIRSAVPLTVSPARPVHAGQFASGSDWQEVKFASLAKGRYFALETASDYLDQTFAAVSELELLDESGRPVPRDDWTIAYADSEEQEKEDGSAENAIDGQPGTFWHSQWSKAAPNHPHRLILDLRRSQYLSGFRYLPRPGNDATGGRIKKYSITVGDDLIEEKPASDLLPSECYLFAYFPDNDSDGLRLFWSVDGYRWEDVNRGQSVLKPNLSQARLMRDPCLLRGPDELFHLVWTDNWTGKTIGHATSRDLLHWSEQTAIPVMAHEPATLNCWAPEIFWDAKREEYLIIWSSTVTNRFRETLNTEQLSNDRLYCTTTKDFRTFSPTRLFYDPGFSLIDATIVAAKGRYFLFFKDETSHPSRKNLRVAESANLQGPFGPPAESFSPGWVEGPTVFPVGGDHVVYFHYYGNNRFGAMRSKDFKHWDDVTERLVLRPGVHQGTVLKVPRQFIAELWRAGKVEMGPTPIAAELGVGNWIWTTNVADKQTCRLWRSFQVPAGTLVSKALLRITADNGYRTFLDGREIGRGGDMNCVTEYDLTRLISSGTHTLAVEGFNDALSAGVLLGLHIELSNGRKVEVLSDPSWRVVPGDERKWETRTEAKASWPSAQLVAFAGRQVWSRPEKILVSPQLQALETYFWQQSWFLLSLLAVCLVVVGFSVRQALQLAVQSRSQRLLQRERDRIARDIHDDLGAGLTQLTLLGELVLRETPHHAETRSRLNTLCGKARALLGSMDEIVWTVNSRRDTVHDFAGFVCEHAQEFLNSTSIRCRLDVAEDLPAIPLDLPARRNLLLAVKEAVRNAARHSQATELFLQVRVTNDQLQVVVEDNGRGLPNHPSDTRNGLRNMSERLADAGGICRVTSVPGKGCRVAFTLPLNSPKLTQKWLWPLAHKLWPGRKPSEPNS